MFLKVSSVNIPALELLLMVNILLKNDFTICLYLFAGVNAVPHFLQNLAPVGLSARHSGLGHCISII